MGKFSVLMSVYFKEKPQYLEECIESILVKQTVIPNELLIIKDGILTDELNEVIDMFLKKFPKVIRVIQLENNVGLGKALRIGILECKNNLIARMDSDDINMKDRFEKQLRVFEVNGNIDLVGSNIGEFFDESKEIKSVRVVPKDNEGIKKMMISRNPINHVTVMFKKDKVLEAGNYEHILYLEDYYLWIRMICKNSNMKNIQEVLVKVRSGKDVFIRRGNKEYINGWRKIQNLLYKERLIGDFRRVLNIMNIYIFIYTPVFIKKGVYKYLLRK